MSTQKTKQQKRSIEMAKFVDDLTRVKPENIQHITHGEPRLIIPVDQPKAEDYAVVVIWQDGESSSFTKDGRPSCTNDRKFIHKTKKVLRLKPLHKLLTDHPGYAVLGSSATIGGCVCRLESLVSMAGETKWLSSSWPDTFYEETEE